MYDTAANIGLPSIFAGKFASPLYIQAAKRPEKNAHIPPSLAPLDYAMYYTGGVPLSRWIDW